MLTDSAPSPMLREWSVLLRIPTSLSTPDDALFGDDFALFPVFLNRGESQSGKLSMHLSPSVTLRPALEPVQGGERAPSASPEDQGSASQGETPAPEA